MTTGYNLPNGCGFAPPPQQRSRQDIEAELDSLYELKEKLCALEIEMDFNNPTELFSTAALTEYEHSNGVDTIDAMIKIVEGKIKELKSI